MNRKTEIHDLLLHTPETIQQQAGDRLIVCADLDALHWQMAQDIASEIEARNADDQPTRLILPVGPTGQYPLLAEMIKRSDISLARVWFFFMSEYSDDTGQAFPATHPLSLKHAVEDLFFSRLAGGYGLNRDQIIFPDETNTGTLADQIEALGGIDTCYGGIGIHGHVAFNEPEAGVKNTGPRRVQLNAVTVTMNALRARVGGNLLGFPHSAFTLGMQQIAGARRIRLACHSDAGFDWAAVALRLALLGTPGDDFPVTHLRAHPGCVIVTDRATLATPDCVL